MRGLSSLGAHLTSLGTPALQRLQLATQYCCSFISKSMQCNSFHHQQVVRRVCAQSLPAQYCVARLACCHTTTSISTSKCSNWRPCHSLEAARSAWRPCHSLAATPREEPVGLQGDDASCVKVTLPCVPGESTELFGDALLGVGATSVMVVEHRPPGAPEQEIFEEPGSGAAGVWDLCDLVVFFPLEADVQGCVDAALDIVEMTLAQEMSQVEVVANRSWVDQIMASYQPLQLSNRMYIVPEWSQPVDPNALNIVLQPGVAFGTGEHPTTRMCLAALEDMESDIQGARVMDYGTGSGVLALAALLLGASSAVGTDTDPLAVRSATRNAELTGVKPGSFAAFLCEPHLDDQEPLSKAGYPRRQFELVMANILRGPLLELQPRLTAYCQPGGTLILSGILSEQVPDILTVYEPHFTDVAVRTDGSWACLVAKKRT